MSEHEDIQVGEFPFIPKQERAQQKRNALLESGHALFISKGYEQTTAKEIAAHAGVATGTFYRYFSDKRQLLLSLLEDKLDRILPPEPSLASCNPEEVLATTLETHYKRLSELGLNRVLPELLLKDIELSEVIVTARRKVLNRIHLGLTQAQEKGLTWKDLDLETVSWAIMVLVENGYEKERQTGKKANYQNIAKVICRMIFPPETLERLGTNHTMDNTD